MAAKSYLESRLWPVLQRNIKDIDPNLNLVDAVDTDTVAGTYIENDVVLCCETGTCIGVSMVALSFYKRVSGVWTLLSYTTQSTMSKRTQKFGVDGNPATPLSNPAPTADAHTARKVDVDGVQTNLTAEETARTNADTTLQTNINGVQTNLNTEADERAIADNYVDQRHYDANVKHPTYETPNIAVGPTSANIEVGTNAALAILLSITNPTTHDAPAIDLETDVTYENDGVDANGGTYDSGSDSYTFPAKTYDTVKSLALKAILAYGAAVAKNNNYAEPDTTYAFDAGTDNASCILNVRFPVFVGAVAAVPTNSAGVRALGAIVSGNSGTMETGTTHKIFVFVCHNTLSLTELKDLDASNANYLPAVVQTSVTVNDPQGANPRTYKVYALSQGSAFSPSHTLSYKFE